MRGRGTVRLADVERLEAREQPSATPLGDVNPTGASGFALVNPYASGAVAGGAVYFFATDGEHAPGLYKSDGTAAGTTLVKDLTPPGGVAAGVPAPSAWNLTAAGGKVYFNWDDGTHGQELWVSDGTAAGTKLVADLNPAAGSYPIIAGEVGGKLVFAPATTSAAGYPYPTTGPSGLWATDGTTAGTAQLTAFNPYDPGRAFTAVGGKIYYAYHTADPATGNVSAQLWVSDGTAAGTKAVATLPTGAWFGMGDPFSAARPQFAVAGSSVYFAAVDGTSGQEVWVADAAGARRVADVNTQPSTDPGYGSGSRARDFVALGSRVYFVADDGTHGDELWATDGTAAGTKLVTDLSPTVGSDSTTPGLPNGSEVTGLTALGGRLYFSADDGTTGPQLYVSDGTAAGTVRLTSVAHTPAPPADSLPMPTPYEDPDVIAAVGGKVLFAIGDAANGRQLWSTDGTKAGTAMVRRFDIEPPVMGGLPGAQTPLGVVGGKLLFHAKDGGDGRQLWGTDGTTAGTARVARINPTTESSAPREFVAAGGKAFFVADGDGGPGVYVTDGRAAPTRLRQFGGTYAGPAATFGPYTDAPQQLTAAGGTAYFVVRAGGYGRQLWATDGTAAGTRVVKELPSDVSGYHFGGVPTGIDNLTAVGSIVYFTLDAPGQGQALWRTDGTAAGTTLVKQTNTAAAADAGGYGNGGPPAVHQLTAANGRLFFVADDGTHGTEVWVSDGTAAGTTMVRDVGAVPTYGTLGGTTGSSPTELTVLGNKVYFVAAPNGTGRELWATDGTSAGTTRVAILSTAGSPPAGRTTWLPQPRQMVAAGGKVFVVVANDWLNSDLWVSDGTAAGTVQLTTSPPPAGGSTAPILMAPAVSSLTAAGGKAYFLRSTGATGRQLWASDGTAAGTALVRSIGTAREYDGTMYPGAPKYLMDANPVIVAAVGGRVVFAADDGTHGKELWVSDGTAAGTRMLQDANPGRGDGVRADLDGIAYATVVGERLIYAGADLAHGAEPWSLPLADLGVTSPPVTPPAVPPVIPPTVPPTDVTAPRVVSAAFTGPSAGTFDRVTVRFDEPVNAATVGKAALTLTGPGGAVGVSAVLPVAGSNGAAYTLMLSRRQTATGTYTLVVGSGVTDLAGNALTRFTTTAALGTPTVPPTVPPVTPPVVPPTVPPVVAAVVRTFAPAATEGRAWSGNLAAVTLPAGPDYKVTVFWGDGRTSAGTLTRNTPTGSAYTVSAAHTYADPGTYRVMVRVTGTGGKTVLSLDATAAVADNRFYAGRVAQRVAVGMPFSGAVATVTDTNPQGGKPSDYAATIDWGDGRTSAGRLRKTAAGKFEVLGDAAFTTAGTKAVKVTITSLATGKTATAESTFVVDPARPRG